jgi:TPR repeat protein
VEQDFKLAVEWYRKAAEKGVAMAQKSLGVLLIQGNGAEKNLEAGLRWLRESSTKGCAAADCELGILHEDGIAVPKDRMEACRLYRRAVAGGNEEARRRLEGLMSKLSDQERAVAQAENRT